MIKHNVNNSSTIIERRIFCDVLIRTDINNDYGCNTIVADIVNTVMLTCATVVKQIF